MLVIAFQKFSMKSVSLLFVLLLICFSNVVYSADEGEKVRIDFTTLSIKNPLDDIAYWDGVEWSPIKVTNGSRSAPIVYNSFPEFRLARIVEGKNPEIIHTSYISETIDTLLFVFVEGKREGKDVINVLRIDETNIDFPANSYRFINFMGEEIVGEINKKRFGLGSFDSKIVKLSNRDANNLKVLLAISLDKGWSPLYSSVWSNNPSLRKTVFILPRGNNPKYATLRTFVDTPPK